MSLKFAASLNFLFGEDAPSLLERMRLAGKAGFRAVEIPFPSREILNSIQSVQSEVGLEVALLNISLGSGELAFGSACIAGAEDTFKIQLNETISLAKILKCKKIHIMSGMKSPTGSYEDHLKTYVENLRYAAKCLETENMIGVIEPICKYALPGYFINNYDTAIYIINEINSPHLGLMVDIFHLQHIRGNVANTFKELKPIIGHVQIAQVPHRNEPDVPGELDYGYVFQVIKESGFNDWIGCDYKPKSNTLAGLGWLNKFGLKL